MGIVGVRLAWLARLLLYRYLALSRGERTPESYPLRGEPERAPREEITSSGLTPPSPTVKACACRFPLRFPIDRMQVYKYSIQQMLLRSVIIIIIIIIIIIVFQQNVKGENVWNRQVVIARGFAPELR